MQHCCSHLRTEACWVMLKVMFDGNQISSCNVVQHGGQTSTTSWTRVSCASPRFSFRFNLWPKARRKVVNNHYQLVELKKQNLPERQAWSLCLLSANGQCHWFDTTPATPTNDNNIAVSSGRSSHNSPTLRKKSKDKIQNRDGICLQRRWEASLKMYQENKIYSLIRLYAKY